MNLQDALGSLASQLNRDANELIQFAQEDEIGGFHFDETLRKWTVGSMWACEGEFIYALVRALKPAAVAEFGTHEGCSATHILSALEANGIGHLTSVDPWEGAGSKVLHGLRERWSMIFHTGIEWLDMQPDASFDILFEDMGHGVVGTRDWWRVALRKIRPGGVILSHDAAHFSVGADVMRGIGDAGVQAAVYAIEPSDCGLAVYVAPGAAVLPEPEYVRTYPGATWEDTPAETQAYDEWVDDGMPDPSYVSSPTPQESDDLDATVHEPVIVEEDELPPATFDGIDPYINSGYVDTTPEPEQDVIEGKLAAQKLPAPAKKPTPRKPSKRKTGGKG